MAFRRFVKRGGNYFPFYTAGHIGHFFGALVNQQNHQYGIFVIGGNGIGNSLHNHRFTRFGGGYNQRALAFADRRNHIYYALGVRGAVNFQREALVGVERG